MRGFVIGLSAFIPAMLFAYALVQAIYRGIRCHGLTCEWEKE